MGYDYVCYKLAICLKTKKYSMQRGAQASKKYPYLFNMRPNTSKS